MFINGQNYSHSLLHLILKLGIYESIHIIFRFLSIRMTNMLVTLILMLTLIPTDVENKHLPFLYQDILRKMSGH